MLLKIGSTGEDVKKLQNKLGLSVDGVFGPGTEKAVKSWQAQNGLNADGLVGNASWERMFADDSAQFNSTTGFDLKLDSLASHVPDLVISQISDCVTKFNINSLLRLAHFLAQCSHESGGFKLKEENLHYSSEGLKKTFPHYFPGNLADSYAKQPEKIASRIYADRMGNGNEGSKEGYKFRGRGYIQLTGRDNYAEFNKSVQDDILNNPELVSEKFALLSAGWFWHSKSLNTLADKGSSDDVVKEITKKVNGGHIGLPDRIALFKKYHHLLS